MDSLKKGDKVAITATARKVSSEEMKPAIQILESWGLKVIIPENLFLDENQFAGSDDIRSKTFQDLLNDPSIKAIFCARGGYGTVRMVDALDFDLFLETPKWVIGYSDITVLHAHIQKKLGYSSLHGPMPINWQKDKLHPESLEHLRKTLFEGPQEIHIPKHPLNLREDDAEGTLIGGNLSVLYSILGSASDPNYDHKILFLEDLDEYLYHIDRMMQGLKRAGKLSNLEALVIGDMSDMKDNTVPFGKTAYEIIADNVKEYSYPVIFGWPAGHESRNLSLVMGTRYHLKVGKQLVLKPC
ncbi:MAG: LD-carboxypeptidase [Bacteroidetes bacterium B1(2017)]|nr:MAG: LD-carboxypeptidase [Bacteroidetes bacterium B1(2017)]